MLPKYPFAKVSCCQSIILPKYHFAKVLFCQSIILPKYQFAKVSFYQIIILSKYQFSKVSFCQNYAMPEYRCVEFCQYEFATIRSQNDEPKSSHNDNLGRPSTTHFAQSLGVKVPMGPSSPVMAANSYPNILQISLLARGDGSTGTIVLCSFGQIFM